MKRMLLFGLTTLAVATALVWFVLRSEHAEEPAAKPNAVEVSSVEDDGPRDGKGVDSTSAHLDPKKRERADEMRAAIRALASARDAERAGDTDAAAKPDPSREDDSTESGLRDRLGLPDATKRAFHQDLMPLVAECIDLAHHRDPDLQGMLAVELGIAAEEELGAVVDTVEFPDRNELSDGEVLECVRETALSLSLPPSDHGGREEVLLTIPVSPSRAPNQP